MGAQARRRAQALRKAREQSHTVAHLQSVKRAARANELYRAAEHGDIHAVLQWTNDPRRPKLRLLLHALLRHKPLEETVFLHVLRWCPQAAQTPNHDGWYPLHLLCYLTARPTPLMLRALCAAGPIAAKMPTSTGWIPLQLLCQQAFARGKARATPATIAAVRQAYPDGAQTYLPDGAEWGDRLPVELLPKELPALELCKQRMTCSDDQLRTFAAQHRSLDLKVRGAYRRRCEEACSNGAVFGVVEVIQELHQETGLIADAADENTGRLLLHDVVARCGATLDGWSLGFCLRACPAAAFHADGRGNLPLHLLLANGECKVTLAEIQSLIRLHPLAVGAKAARGWTCLHAFCRRPPQQQDLRVLRLLLRGVAGRKAARTRDEDGDLPLHLLAYACTDQREARVADLNVGQDTQVEWGADRAKPLCQALVGAYPPAWRIKGSRELTACDAAPADLQGVLMGAATTKGPSSLTDVSRAIARAKPRRRKAGAGLPLVKLIEIGADDALQKRLRVEKHRDPEPIPIDLLHTLLKRDAGVGGDVLRAVADAGGAGSCALRDGDGYLPLHLVAKRAPFDERVTPQTVRRVLAYHRPAAFYRGGARKLCPLAAFAVALATGAEDQGASDEGGSQRAGNYFTDEPLAHWRERCLGVARALYESTPKARVVPASDGALACELLPPSPDYDALRAAMRPKQAPLRENDGERPTHLRCKKAPPRRAKEEDVDKDDPAARRMPEAGATEMTRCIPLLVPAQLDPLVDPQRPETAASDALDLQAYLARPATSVSGVPRPNTAGGTLRPTTPGGTVLVRESVEAQNAKRGRPRTPRSPGGSVLYATPRGTRLLRPLTGGGTERPLTPGGSIEGLPVDERGVRRPMTPQTKRLIKPCTPGGTFRPTTRGGTLLRRSDRHEVATELPGDDSPPHSPHRRSNVTFDDEPLRSFDDAERPRRKSMRPASRKRRRRERAAAAEAEIIDREARKAAEAEARMAAAEENQRLERRRRRKALRQQRHDRLDAFMGLPRLTSL